MADDDRVSHSRLDFERQRKRAKDGIGTNYFRSSIARDPSWDPASFSVARGGKLITCHGTTSLRGWGGRVRDRLADAYREMDRAGEAPAALRGQHPPFAFGPPGAPPTPAKAFTRPVCAYPLVAKYKCMGDDSDAASFACASPRDRPAS